MEDKNGKTLFGLPIIKTNDSIKGIESIKFGGPLLPTQDEIREVKFINGPFKDRVITLNDNRITKIVVSMLDEKEECIQIEYEIKQDKNGQGILINCLL